ncbi:MAG: tRNA-binding protein [Patescibacteria group bacterium]|jgi:tRNA-binding protein
MITYEDFDKVDIRLGKIIKVEDFPEAKKPAFKLTIDFGSEIGIKRSSVQLVGSYAREELMNMLVACVVNFPIKKIASFESEVLTLGFKNNSDQGYILVSPTKNMVNLGDKLC